jgi:hypothetical protein
MLKSTFFAWLGVFAPSIIASPLVSPNTELVSRQGLLGLINFDNVLINCNATEQKIIMRAFTDLHFLTDAVQGISGDDPYFVKFFGVGWSGSKFGDAYWFIPGNLDKAKTASLDKTSSGKIFVTCKDVSNKCNEENDETKAKPSAYTSIPRTDGTLQTMVWCPRAFNHFHLTDRSPSSLTNLKTLTSYESIALHELMHFDYAGYQTAVSAHADPENTSFNDNNSMLPHISSYPPPQKPAPC